MLVAGVLATWSSFAFALNPSLDISQYAHTAWRIRDGFSKGAILTIAQTPDGYMWLGTELGMLRFDGVRPVPWQPPAGQQLPSANIRSLLVTHDGVLWIGTDAGLASWQDGTLVRYEPLAGRFVNRLVEDREGNIWATTFFNFRWTLCEIRRAGAACHGDDGGPGVGAISIQEDRAGRLWVGTIGTTNGLWRWKPGVPKFYPLPWQENGIRGLGEDADGVLMVTLVGGVSRFIDGETVVAYRFPASTRARSFRAQLLDRDGALWVAGSTDGGLMHFHAGVTDSFTSSDGLSGDAIYTLFQDREGNIWVATREGLDRFRDLPVATYSVKQGLSSAFVSSVLAARDGSIWIGTSFGLNHWNHGQLTGRWQPTRDASVQSIFQDSLGRLWVSSLNEVGILNANRFTALEGVGGGLIRWIGEDADANLWIANADRGLFRVSIRTGEVELTRWDRLNRGAPPVAMAADPSLKGVWLGFRQDGLVYFADGQVHASFGAANGLGEGMRSLQLDRDGALWAAMDGGLSRVKNGRVATMTSKNGLPCDGVEWLVEGDDRALWLGTRCGLVHIAQADLAGWITSLDNAQQDPRKAIQTTVFDVSDGVRTDIAASYYSRPAVRGSDGRLWFVSPGGVSVVDRRSLAFNSLPPPVHVEQLIADRTAYAVATGAEPLRLPALTRDLQIDYTALSLVAPEKMQFRYKLEGHDDDWQEAGNRRQAFYNDLAPGNYRFRVIASNNSGVWNETGATLNFDVAPAYYQTTWFRLLVLAAFLAVVAVVHRLRVRQVALQYNARLEARVGERMRIARDLHDTLLQSFQGLLLKFHALSYELGDNDKARHDLEAVVEQARRAITEGRDAVQGLRASTLPGNDLARAIITFGDELAVANGERRAELDVHVAGASRDLASLVHDDVYRIACEALRNAYKHARATRIEVEIHYDQRQLRLRIRDDGRGIDPAVLRGGAREGHFGLPGMHERAAAVGGTLTTWSELGSGTEIELTIPAGIAYAKASASLVPEET